MTGIVIVGTQFGDEGKGRVVDFFASKSDLVIRFQGGNNAGHTVIVGEQEFKMHLLPSGVVQKKKSLIAAGVVIDPKVLLQEIEKITKTVGKPDLVIDPRAHIIMPYHIMLDEADELLRDNKIGTTKRGIGPCYAEKAYRSGIRVEDLVDETRLKKKLEEILPLKKKILENVYNYKNDLSVEKVFEEYAVLGEKLAPFVGDVSSIVNTALEEKKNVLFESAQGTFLDMDFGTYPFVTSSHPIAGAVCAGVGIGCSAVEKVVGIVKAYTTRVGSGILVSEIQGELADKIRAVGKEFGTTTGRPRRIGWLDLVLLRTAKRLNGLNEIIITKLDVLSGLEKVQVCTHYKLNGKKLEEVPALSSDLDKCKPVFKEFKGFEIKQNTKKYSDLPKNARNYLEFIEKELRVKISFVCIGAERKQVIKK